MTILAERGLTFNVNIEPDGTWAVWIRLADGSNFKQAGFLNKARAYSWVERRVAAQKIAA